MASTKVTFVTGTAEVKRRDPSYSSYSPSGLPPDQHFTTEPIKPLQVTYIDGKCTCCPFGYHIDLDFLNFCRDLESGSTLKNLKRIQRTKRKLRKSMELMLDEKDGIVIDPNSAPPDVVHSTEAGRLMHMINYERSATHRILNQIDSTITTSTTEGPKGRRYISSDSDEPNTPYSPPHGNPHPLDESNRMTTSFSTSGRTDSLSSLSSVSTVSSEAQMLHQAHYTMQHYQQQQQQHYHHSSRTTTKVEENPVLEMGTAEVKQYTTTSSAQLAEPEFQEPEFRPPERKPTKTPPPVMPRASPDVNQMSLQSVREAMSVSLQRMRELEEQVKTIPILQVRISVLKEEKRLLNLQLKAAKANSRPPTSHIGVGETRVDVKEKIDRSVHLSRSFELPMSYTTDAPISPQRSPMIKSPPATLPKPVRTISVAVGDHSVVEPYNLQPDLPTGYTIHDNETYTEIHSRSVLEQEEIRTRRFPAPSLNVSFQPSQFEYAHREIRSPMVTQQATESTQPHFTINQIQRSTLKAMTRTVGVGDGNVFEGSGLHVHEKELRTVIFGQTPNVAKRNVGIECRVPTRDVGVSFMCDEAKPETRTVGVNVNYDTSSILTSLDFKGETELRMALRGVLQRNVRSVGTNCNFKPSTVEVGTYTDMTTGISVGCGDENHRIDIDIRQPVVTKSVAVTVRPDTGNKYVTTDKDWVMDRGTNTYQTDTYHKAVMTEKQKQSFASTNTEAPLTHSASNQTDRGMFMAMNLYKHATSNTEQVSTMSTGIMTDIVTRFSTGVNTAGDVHELIRNAASSEEKKTVTVTTVPLKSALKKARTVDKGVGDDRIDDDIYSFSETTTEFSRASQMASSPKQSSSVQEQILQKGVQQADAFLNQSEYSKSSSRVDDGDKHYRSYEISSRSSPMKKGYTNDREGSVQHSSYDERNSTIAVTITPPTPEETQFSETVVEHFIITNEGKQLISEEKTTTSAKGTDHSFKQYSQPEQTWSRRISEPTISSSSYSSSSSGNIISGSTDGGSGGFSSSSITYGPDSGTSSTKVVEKSYSSVINNPYKTVENLAEVSSILDSDSVDSGGLNHRSKTASEGNLYSESKMTTSSQRDNSKSLETIYDMRRTGSVEDFMPDDIRKYMSIDPSTSKDSGFGEELLQKFTERSSASSSSSSSQPSKAASSSGGGMKSFKSSKTVTTKRTIRDGDKVIVQETKSTEGPDGKLITVITETDENGRVTTRQEGGADSQQAQLLGSHGASEVMTTSSSSMSYSASQGGSDTNLSSSVSGQPAFSGTKSFSESTMTTVGEGDEGMEGEGYGSLDRRTGKLKSIMKRSKSDTQRMSKKGITFAESVTGGNGTSSEEDNTSDSDSTTSFEEGSYDSQQGQVVYACKDDEAIAQGLPGAQMFDQNIRETYELTDEVRDACSVLATYLTDSTLVQTKQLNASLNIIQQEWFQVSSHKLSSSHQVEDFLSSVNEISKRLLEYIVNMTDANGNTAIHYCISHGNFEIANLLMDAEVCDINKQNKAGYTPIMLAGLVTVQNQEQREVIRRIFSTGDINARASVTHQTALMLAASHGRTEMVQLLVEEGADVNLQDVDGSTALMCACEHGHLDIVNYLLAHPNTDASITDSENSTALTIAMEAGHKDVGVVLYKHMNFSKPTSPGYHKKKKSPSSPTPSTFVIR